MRVIPIFFLVLVVGVAAQGQESCFNTPEAVSLCAVLLKPADYDGKEVIVRGVYQPVFHGTVLSSRECSHQRVNLRRLSPKLGGEKKNVKLLAKLVDRDQAAETVFRGRFAVAQIGQCFGQDCDPYEIVVGELMCVRPERALQTPPHPAN